jgi:hypothetical protein
MRLDTQQPPLSENLHRPKKTFDTIHGARYPSIPDDRSSDSWHSMQNKNDGVLLSSSFCVFFFLMSIWILERLGVPGLALLHARPFDFLFDSARA